MIKRLVVKGLNNRADGTHDLAFHPDLNIFTGPNGSGKTTLLKLIWYLISGNLERILLEMSFHSISIETTPFSLTLNRVNPQVVKLDAKFASGKALLETFAVNPQTGDLDQQDDMSKLDDINQRVAQVTESSLFFPTFRRIEGGFSSLSRYSNAFPRRYRSDPIRYYPYHGTTEILQEAMHAFSTAVSVDDHKFIASISTDDIVRLLTQKYADVSEHINNLHAELTSKITQETLGNSGREQGSAHQNPQNAMPVLEEIQKSVEQVTRAREEFLEPFSVLSELSQNILKYQAISITERFTPREGTDGITLGAGKDGITLGETKEAISSDKLSAGEKQMLSFLCYNAFSDNAAIFIDEPELSLHVDWQRLLLPVLLQQQTNNQFFVATHSPFVAMKYPDKEFPLGDDRGGEI